MTAPIAPVMPVPPPVFPVMPVHSPYVDDRLSEDDAYVLARAAQLIRKQADQFPNQNGACVLLIQAAHLDALARDDSEEAVRLVNVMGRW
ncbi:hypothetical protein EOD42_23365 [Rhodovarius crocodyli]|uniref:Uncharacterized protein n=1 Tax=Rhodovarius crocodyli TaxID=1979269 RepID=A0A437LZR8_9PROT|nr:hypothetical protein [Rhodovarius crocodyli]RVT90744.1 hypothetical protein EOD42_23365 [Rhodovarius crocodyli]